jgi:hypothetical protein
VVDLLSVPTHRIEAIERLAREFRAGRSVAISTHINSDGDGCGSEVALARLLTQLGIDARIANPTPWPAMVDFLLGDDERVYLSEMTFSPGNATTPLPRELDVQLGALWAASLIED